MTPRDVKPYCWIKPRDFFTGHEVVEDEPIEGVRAIPVYSASKLDAAREEGRKEAVYSIESIRQRAYEHGRASAFEEAAKIVEKRHNPRDLCDHTECDHAGWGNFDDSCSHGGDAREAWVTNELAKEIRAAMGKEKKE